MLEQVANKKECYPRVIVGFFQYIVQEETVIPCSLHCTAITGNCFLYCGASHFVAVENWRILEIAVKASGNSMSSSSGNAKERWVKEKAKTQYGNDGYTHEIASQPKVENTMFCTMLRKSPGYQSVEGDLIIHLSSNSPCESLATVYLVESSKR
jgi:hypothetical protein